jgi:hypothetical protein
MSDSLIERLRKSSGPDRHLDALIWLSDKPQGQRDACLIHLNCDIEWTCAKDGYLNWRQTYTPPAYTASLDAALTLVPEDWRVNDMCETEDRRWNVSLWRERVPEEAHPQVINAGDLNSSAAIGICIAALLARGAQ